MENLIRVLPDSVASQIAAGEVIQRPASVVKELVENAIDAGATQIDVALKDAGRNLIMVLDNGKGMSPSDAHVAFERHATSKLRQASDLFQLHTMGFRGEALASIASVAQVDLVTRRPKDELAWKVEIEGSKITNEEPSLAAQGSRFTVRNLFYNIPARRKFLSENSKELRYIRDEFIQIALVYPNLNMSLTHNDEVLYQLSPTTIRQRIIAIFGKRSGGQLGKQLYAVDVNTQLIKISGFIGDPAASCHRDSMQYFFVNGRFIRHKLFRSAVMKAYETLIPTGQLPTYFLYFDVDPEALDVNIHPTKTEVKFEHEQAIWPIIHAAVREALGKANAVPSLDFDRDDAPEIRVFTGDRAVDAPHVRFDPTYNPFHPSPKQTVPNWDALFEGFEKGAGMGKSYQKVENIQPEEQNKLKDLASAFSEGFDILPKDDFLNEVQDTAGLFANETNKIDANLTKFQLFGSYIVLYSSQYLSFIDQHRAHVRVLFEKYQSILVNGIAPSQTLLFPEELQIDVLQRNELLEMLDDIQALGFKVNCEGDDFFVAAVPNDLDDIDPCILILDMMESMHHPEVDFQGDRRDRLALRLANSASIPNGRVLNEIEMDNLIQKLFSCAEPKYTPDGKNIMLQIMAEDLLKRF
ncbi:MAG: DNA mismatch repair endonuclease MutL [Bacteroidales bacterium]|nr:DNA mismatch repair endonuclease MutL [Bacteroidales bacterium]